MGNPVSPLSGFTSFFCKSSGGLFSSFSSLNLVSNTKLTAQYKRCGRSDYSSYTTVPDVHADSLACGEQVVPRAALEHRVVLLVGAGERQRVRERRRQLSHHVRIHPRVHLRDVGFSAEQELEGAAAGVGIKVAANNESIDVAQPLLDFRQLPGHSKRALCRRYAVW